MPLGRHVVPQKPETRRASIGDPHILIAVLIPIDQRDRPAVIRKIEAGYGRDVGESRPCFQIRHTIEKAAVTLATAERPTAPQHRAQCPERAGQFMLWRMRIIG